MYTNEQCCNVLQQKYCTNSAGHLTSMGTAWTVEEAWVTPLNIILRTLILRASLTQTLPVRAGWLLLLVDSSLSQNESLQVCHKLSTDRTASKGYRWKRHLPEGTEKNP